MTARTLLVLGAGGHGRVVADAARCAGYEVVGYVDRDASRLGAPVDGEGATVLLGEDELLARLADGRPVPSQLLALGIGRNDVRLALADRLGAALAPAIVHPRATVARSARIDAGTVVMANAVVNPDARIGLAVIVNTAAVIEHDCVLGDGVHVSPGAVLAGAASVDALGWVAAGAVVLPQVRVGARAVVGAGAVVHRDVPADLTVVGVPAHPLSSSA